MLYMVCPTCGNLLGNKQLLYVNGMKAICDKFNVDDTAISSGIDKNPEFVEERKKLIQELFPSMCCRMRAMTYVELVELIKG